MPYSDHDSVASNSYLGSGRLELSSSDDRLGDEGRSKASDTHSLPPSYRVHLPVEVWQVIFEALLQKARARSARICFALRYAAEAVLYRFPHLYSFAAAEKFAQTVLQYTPDPLSLLAAEYNLEDRDQFLKTFGSSLGNLMDFLLEHHPQLLAGLTAMCPALLERLPMLDSVELLDEDALHYVELLSRGREIRFKRLQTNTLKQMESIMYFASPSPEVENIRLSVQQCQRPLAPLRLANIRVLACKAPAVNAAAFAVTFPNLTSLDVQGITSKGVDSVIATIGHQLVGLRLELHVRAGGERPGRMYPTHDHNWRRCVRLKDLEISHRPEWSDDVMHYFADDPLDTENLPPVLEKLVWAPAWTRIYSSHVYPDEQKRADLTTFAEAVLRASKTLRLVAYEWSGEQLYQCWLMSPLGLTAELADFRESPLYA